MANQHEMSVHKFKVSQQGSPMNEKKPSTEVDHDKKTNSGNQQREKDAHENSDKQSVPTVPSNEKNNGNENPKESNELKNPKLSNLRQSRIRSRMKSSSIPRRRRGIHLILNRKMKMPIREIKTLYRSSLRKIQISRSSREPTMVMEIKPLQ